MNKELFAKVGICCLWILALGISASISLFIITSLIVSSF
nr:MAG TPA: hypothetical protein [Caudoviricetes sp.]